MTEAERPHRAIRSYTLRQGRLTPAQQRAMDELFPRFGVPCGETPLDFATIFGRSAPRVLEIGFGNGDSLAAIAQAHPDIDYLGIEVHTPGVGHLLLRIEELALTNLRVMRDDAVEVLTRRIADASLDAVYLFFADPWPKKRHHKRRIVQEEFVQLLRRKLKIGGHFHMATDWEDYARHMLEVMNVAAGFRNTSPSGDYVPRPDYRPLTKFEQRGQRLGHGVWDLIFERID
ncbi:tRNA (guanosine(46)-N7)-methyltransferase TrmB [Sulfurivermis fontis]|uniref:tRNA (guanosine(46)-N7)-methyltransferase TrmB n=1 Tax=Sulfurivermis fontis TaxID=1972068 RepID=UPI001E53C4F3|nr:tRNA (guanosine(46)-N7)-methyltransferase TrmB [Sulfurivermis fontis]